MVGIYGMVGVGKTTFMKNISCKFLEITNYKVIWRVVSKMVDMDKIRAQVMNEISASSLERKVALLFDDIGEFLDLEELGIFYVIYFENSNCNLTEKSKSNTWVGMILGHC